MKISVVTVCFNEEENIERTIKSVLRQSDTSYEYIICDGKSTDKTVEIAESYRQAFEEKGVNYILKSEKDGGIYYGMNNGIDLATGDYLIFINAGDCLHGTEAIKTIVDVIKKSENKIDVLYGDINFVQRGRYHRIAGNHSDLKQGMSICHQAMVISGEIMKNERFNTEYKIGADYDLALKLYLGDKNFLHVDEVISDFYAGGVSNVKIRETVEESFKIRDVYSIGYDVTAEMKRAAKSERFEKIKLKMPRCIWALWCKIKKRVKEEELGN
ncbi:MAG: glycosyltransferase [Clostridia bacterium]|nr:glycosyltransferase [Clostridia bacterium]